MVTIQDVYDQVKCVCDKITSLDVQNSYTNEALYHIAQQNDTLICCCDKTAQMICDFLNEEHTQTELQHSINDSLSEMLKLVKYANPNAALQLEDLSKLHKEIEKCCPPVPLPPICSYKKCPPPETTLPRPPVPTCPPGQYWNAELRRCVPD